MTSLWTGVLRTAAVFIIVVTSETGALPITDDEGTIKTAKRQDGDDVYPVRAMWVPTIEGALTLDTPPGVQRRELDDTMNAASKLNIDTIFFQILPHGGAGYCGERSSEVVRSETGWNAMDYIVREARKRNIKIHAWINLFRAGLQYIKGNNNDGGFRKQYRNYCYEYGDFLWADPSTKEVQDHVMHDVTELTSRYNLDGVHIDDFYYPPPLPGGEFPDDSLYRDYLVNNGTLTRDAWRRENIQAFMSRLHSKVTMSGSKVESTRPKVAFSLNTFGLYHCGGMEADCGNLRSQYHVTPMAAQWPNTTSVIGDFLTPQTHWQLDEDDDDEPSEGRTTGLLLDWRAGEEPTRSLYTGDGRYRLLDPAWDVFNLVAIPTPSGRVKRADDSSDLSSQVSFRLFTDIDQQEALSLPEPYNQYNWSMSEGSWLYIIIHGYFSNPGKAWISDIRTALLNVTDSSWVVVVDWETLADAVWYPTSKSRIPVVAEKIKVMLQGLMDHAGLTPDRVHCIGHSLGAHTCGLAGKTYYFGRISGLDPAGPQFSVEDNQSRLSYRDARFVDVIHTDVGLGELNFGMEEPIGDVDFYPNGGSWRQPGCWKPVCSHRRAPLYYAVSLKDDCFNVTSKCTSADDLPKHCESSPNETLYTRMGYYSDTYNATGIYYLQTGSGAPYCYGRSPIERAEVLLVSAIAVILLLIFGVS